MCIFRQIVTFAFRFRYIAVTPMFPDSLRRAKSFLILPLHSAVDDRYLSVTFVYVGCAGSGKLCYGRDELSGSAATGSAELFGRTCDLSTTTEFVKDA